jgi:enoyl-CoA hydratase/carnithine racemase
MEGEVRSEIEGKAGVVTLSRRGKHNAMTASMWRQIPPKLDELVASAGVHAVVIKGAHGAFSAGADLTEVLAATADEGAARDFCGSVVAALEAIAACPVPTLAAMAGVAAGGGVEVALAADLRVAEPVVTMELPLARLGVVPDDFTLRRLHALGGGSTARRMLLAGRTLDSEECLRAGLIDELVEPGGLDEAVDRLIVGFTRSSPFALRRMKKLLGEYERQASSTDPIANMADSFVHGDVATSARSFLGRARGARPTTTSRNPKENVS